MTNFEILKNSIWDAVKTDDKEAFDKNCEDLMGKACNDIWRIGWSLRPKDINDVYEMLDDIAKWCHERWIEAMKCGDAPPEDASPAEGIRLIKQVIYDAVKGSVIQGGVEMKHMIAWTEFNRGGEEMRHAEPKDMTKQEVLDAVAEWYDAIGTGLNDFEGIQLFRLKRKEGGKNV